MSKTINPIEQFIQKCNKKAFKEIKLISNASNMLEVQYAMSVAILKTFGLYNGAYENIYGQKQC